jgi:hypothetical protein
MGNDLTKRPMILDTGGGGVLTKDLLYVSKIRWVNVAGVAGDLVILKDAAGTIKWHSVCAGADYVEESTFIPDNEHSWLGLNADTITRGIVYLYLG